MRIITALICSQLMLAAAHATPVVYTIDSSRSSITLSGSSDGQPFTPQQSGSLTTNFTGTIQADRTASQILFTGANILAANSGEYMPAAGSHTGTSPANYGLNVFVSNINLTASGAVRNLRTNITSPNLTIVSNQFPSNQLTLNFLGGSFDLTLGSPGTNFALPINQAPFNNTGVPGTVVTAGIRETIAFPIVAGQVDAPVGGGVTQFNYTGQLVASRISLKKFVLILLPFHWFAVNSYPREAVIDPENSATYPFEF